MLENCIAISAGIGGVGKTTLASHLAANAAARGMRVLLVDCDPQGNTVFDLGYITDHGTNLERALNNGSPLAPIVNVRTNLDVIPGGHHLDGAIRRLTLSDDKHALQRSLNPLAAFYQLVVVDSPARELVLRNNILTAARFVIIPSANDTASEHGLNDLAATINQIRDTTNPQLDVLAVVASPIARASTQVRRRATDRLGNLIGDPGLVCATIVGHASAVAEHCRHHRILTHEYASLTNGHPLSGGGPTLDLGEVDLRDASTSAARIAQDWRTLTTELLDRYTTACAEPPQPAPNTTATSDADGTNRAVADRLGNVTPIAVDQR